MKAERKTLIISDATSLYEAVGKIIGNTDMFPELERALDFCYKMVIEYRVWLAWHKEHTWPMNFHQDGYKLKKVIWIIKFMEKDSSEDQDVSALEIQSQENQKGVEK